VVEVRMVPLPLAQEDPIAAHQAVALVPEVPMVAHRLIQEVHLVEHLLVPEAHTVALPLAPEAPIVVHQAAALVQEARMVVHLLVLAILTAGHPLALVLPAEAPAHIMVHPPAAGAPTAHRHLQLPLALHMEPQVVHLPRHHPHHTEAHLDQVQVPVLLMETLMGPHQQRRYPLEARQALALAQTLMVVHQVVPLLQLAVAALMDLHQLQPHLPHHTEALQLQTQTLTVVHQLEALFLLEVATPMDLLLRQLRHPHHMEVHLLPQAQTLTAVHQVEALPRLEVATLMDLRHLQQPQALPMEVQAVELHQPHPHLTEAPQDRHQILVHIAVHHPPAHQAVTLMGLRLQRQLLLITAAAVQALAQAHTAAHQVVIQIHTLVLQLVALHPTLTIAPLLPTMSLFTTHKVTRFCESQFHSFSM